MESGTPQTRRLTNICMNIQASLHIQSYIFSRITSSSVSNASAALQFKPCRRHRLLKLAEMPKDFSEINLTALWLAYSHHGLQQQGMKNAVFRGTRVNFLTFNPKRKIFVFDGFTFILKRFLVWRVLIGKWFHQFWINETLAGGMRNMPIFPWVLSRYHTLWNVKALKDTILRWWTEIFQFCGHGMCYTGETVLAIWAAG